LDQAVKQEESIAAGSGIALHRTIQLEERRMQTSVCEDCPGEFISQRKIEIWQSADRGLVTRRLFDERGTLVAGDWRRSDGVQTLYHHGTKPQLQLAPDHRPGAPLTFDSVWQLSPSAREFSSLIGDTATHYQTSTARRGDDL